MAVCMLLITAVVAYTLWMLVKLIYHQGKINDASLDAFQSINDWCEVIEKKVNELEQRIEKAESLAGNASNKANITEMKVKRMQGYE